MDLDWSVPRHCRHRLPRQLSVRRQSAQVLAPGQHSTPAGGDREPRGRDGGPAGRGRWVARPVQGPRVPVGSRVVGGDSEAHAARQTDTAHPADDVRSLGAGLLLGRVLQGRWRL
jgi:hypothetical protein